MGAGVTVDWAGFPPLELAVECGGEQHVVRWADGELSAPEHDGGGESVLTALGGAPPRCSRVVEAWTRVARPASPTVITEALEATAWRLTIGRTVEPPAGWQETFEWLMLQRTRRPQHRHMARRATKGRVPPPRPRVARNPRQGLELELGGPLPVPWTAVALAPHLWDLDAWARLPGDDRESARASILVLVVMTLLQCDPLPEEMPLLRIDEWSVASYDDEEVVLPPSWVARVLARQAAVIDDQLTLDLVPHASGDGRFIAQQLAVSPRGRVTSGSSTVRLGDDAR
jgi:hypothetical protein